MTTPIASPEISHAAGLIAFVLVAAWPLLRGRVPLLIGQAVAAAAFAAHYLLIGAVTGGLLSLVSVIQCLSAVPPPGPWIRPIYAATVPSLAILTLLSWSGWPSACAALGLTLATAARWQRNPAALRTLFLLSGIAWVAHDILTDSLYGLAADLVCMLVLADGIRRHRDAPAPSPVA